MGNPSVRIENVVASVVLDQYIDLEAITRNIPTVDYNPDQFPGLVFRLNRPKTATLIFSSGKMVCTGAKSEKDVKRAIKKIISTLKSKGIVVVGKPKITIQNIVASANLKAGVNLEKAAMLLENVMYEPEQFPGLIYRMNEPKVVLLLFSSGKMVCTGAKREEEVYVAVKKINEKLREMGLLYEEGD
ncbi:MAG: TATA-box-binding protein [Candidatus Verstraetearchaeota archaeon]|nr:TATA-box-binding protein [Candidatus Verstraetearchaeota archaeon]RLE57532.1 MAG: TATA-box-binding protein [Candidatus Verstraetearchaeota archaeon]